MRNEVFKKISQNRKRYLIENSRIEVSKEKPVGKPRTKKKRSGVKSPFLSVKTSTSIGSGIADSVSRFVTKKVDNGKINFAIDSIKEKMQKIGAFRRLKLQSANRKLSKGSEKIFDSFVNYSDRFFEDRFVKVDEDNPTLKSFALQSVSSTQMVWEFADTKTHVGYLPPFRESYLGYFMKKIRNSFIRNWRKFIFSLELDGVLLELTQSNKSSITASGNNPNTIEIKDDMPLTIKPVAKYNSTKNRISTSKEKRVGRIVNRLAKALNYERFCSLNKTVTKYLVEFKKSFKDRHSKNKSVRFQQMMFSEINRFIMTVSSFLFTNISTFLH